MNWTAFFVVLLGVPLAGAVLATAQLAAARLLVHWFETEEGLREAVKAGFALMWLIVAALVAGLVWK